MRLKNKEIIANLRNKVKELEIEKLAWIQAESNAKYELEKVQQELDTIVSKENQKIRELDSRLVGFQKKYNQLRSDFVSTKREYFEIEQLKQRWFFKVYKNLRKAG